MTNENGINVIEIKDPERGDIVIKKCGKFEIWYQIDNPGGYCWEKAGTHNTLAEAMSEVVEVLKANIENYFYEE